MQKNKHEIDKIAFYYEGGSMNKKFVFENLAVWHESKSFAKNIYKATENFPNSEKFGLTNQLRRAVVSISLNIAEGKGRYSKKEFVQFLFIARGSLFEVITCLSLAFDFNFINDHEYEKIRNQAFFLQSQLSRLISSIKESN